MVEDKESNRAYETKNIVYKEILEDMLVFHYSSKFFLLHISLLKIRNMVISKRIYMNQQNYVASLFYFK